MVESDGDEYMDDDFEQTSLNKTDRKNHVELDQTPARVASVIGE